MSPTKVGIITKSRTQIKKRKSIIRKYNKIKKSNRDKIHKETVYRMEIKFR